jgi:hypothetical protein
MRVHCNVILLYFSYLSFYIELILWFYYFCGFLYFYDLHKGFAYSSRVEGFELAKITSSGYNLCLVYN